ncbi:hypothetical protein D3C76_1632610 [compost metagenome]
MLTCTVQAFKQRENVMPLSHFLHVMLQTITCNKQSHTTLAQLLQSRLNIRIQLSHVLLQTNQLIFQQQVISPQMNLL